VGLGAVVILAIVAGFLIALDRALSALLGMSRGASRWISTGLAIGGVRPPSRTSAYAWANHPFGGWPDPRRLVSLPAQALERGGSTPIDPAHHAMNGRHNQ
jgi:hypothetical protein